MGRGRRWLGIRRMVRNGGCWGVEQGADIYDVGRPLSVVRCTDVSCSVSKVPCALIQAVWSGTSFKRTAAWCRARRSRAESAFAGDD